MNKPTIYTILAVAVSTMLITVYFITKIDKKQFGSIATIKPTSTVKIGVSPTSPPTQSVIKKTISITPTSSPKPKKILTVAPMPTVIPTSVPVSSVRVDFITPSSGKVGDVIVIKGSGFGKSSFYYPDPTQFKGMVSFYGSSGMNSGGAPPAEEGAGWWSDNQIKVKVPGIAAGFFQVEVTSSEGERSNRIPFVVTN